MIIWLELVSSMSFDSRSVLESQKILVSILSTNKERLKKIHPMLHERITQFVSKLLGKIIMKLLPFKIEQLQDFLKNTHQSNEEKIRSISMYKTFFKNQRTQKMHPKVEGALNNLELNLYVLTQNIKKIRILACSEIKLSEEHRKFITSKMARALKTGTCRIRRTRST